MKNTTVVLIAVLTVLLAHRTSSARKLVDLIPSLYGGDGLSLGTDPAASHTAHFAIASAASINQLNEQIAAEIGAFPVSSAVGGFTFAFDPLLNTFVRTTETLGPLFAERAPTLGRGKLNLNLSFTFFKYDEFNGESLDNLRVVTRHDPDIIGFPDEREQFENDVVRLNIDLDIRVWVLALAATYGLTERLDIGIFIPIAHVDMHIKSRAEIVQSSENTLFPNVHFFDNGIESPNSEASGDALGLGDIVLRAKYHAFESDIVDLAAALLIKLATGDEKDFLGTGDTTVRPFLIASRTFSDIFGWSLDLTPHLNVGYEFNVDQSQQNSVEYVVGFDLGIPRLTFAAEFLGSHELDGDGLGDDILSASFGAKWNPVGRLLMTANVQIPLNDEGLRSDLITTVGVEYSF